MIHLRTKGLAVAACTTLAVIGGSARLAAADPVTVVHLDEPDVVNTIPFVGCDGAPVTTTFTGWLRATMVIQPGGSTNLTLKTREVATWEQDGVDYTADVVFNLHDTVHVGDVTTVVTNGVGQGSD